ncbi:hypothetical protein BC829DRAFT_422578 [Chytridium lagenaria]|nr:hypothetical protein BC829DRAFT_422578 [Chytridium lagenaria]
MTINESKVMGNSSRHLAFDNHPSSSTKDPRNASTEKNTSGKAGNPQHHANKGRVEKKKPRPRLNGAGIPENARLLSLKAGTDLPIIKDLSNNIMAQFRAMNALLGIPFCHENLNRFMRNQRPRRKGELDERYLSNEECKSLASESSGGWSHASTTSSSSWTPPVKKNVVKAAAAAKTTIIVDSDDENDLSQVASSSRRPVECKKTFVGPLEPMDCDADDGIKSSYVPRDVRRNSLEETGQPSQDEEIYLFQPEDNPSILENLPGLNLKKPSANGTLDSLTLALSSLNAERQLSLSFLLLKPPPKPQLDVRRSWEVVRSNIAVIHLMADRLKSMRLHDLEAGLKQGSYMPAMPPPPPEPRGPPAAALEKRRDPITPTKDTVMTSSDEAINTFDTTTDTTTASRGSVNASDDESDASDQPPDPRQVKGKALALPLRAPRGVRHHASVKQKVSLAEYKARLVASREKNNDPCNEERRKKY